MLSLSRDDGRGLDAGRSCADLADAFPCEIDAFVGPGAGVVPFALKVLKPRNVGDVGGR